MPTGNCVTLSASTAPKAHLTATAARAVNRSNLIVGILYIELMTFKNPPPLIVARGPIYFSGIVGFYPNAIYIHIYHIIYQ